MNPAAQYEFLFSTVFNNTIDQNQIAIYTNNGNPFNVYKLIEIKSFPARQEMRWIPYSQIKNLRKIAEGGFSIIYKATWSDGINDTDVAIKKLFNSQNISKYFLNEVTLILYLFCNVFYLILIDKFIL